MGGVEGGERGYQAGQLGGGDIGYFTQFGGV